MQLTTASGNYSRYILHKLIESLDVPYYQTPANGESTTGLFRLSTAVAESPTLDRDLVLRLREEPLEHDERATLVQNLADEAVRSPVLANVPIDLVMAMLFLQSNHPAIRHRVMKYLRAESLSEHDRRQLGGISPLDREENAQAMIERLGHLMWAVHHAALIICVDQLEGVSVLDGAAEKFRRAINGLTQITAHVPSSLMVIACLEDYYDVLRGHLDAWSLDRIEKDPTPLTLAGGRSWQEVVDIVGLHLQHLFDHFDLPADDRKSTYPIPDRLLREQVNQTARIVLNTCREYRDCCIQQGRLVDATASNGMDDRPSVPGPVSERRPAESEQSFVRFDQAWNDFVAGYEQAPPDSDDELLALLATSMELCSGELGTPYACTADIDGAHAKITVQTTCESRLLCTAMVKICNKVPHGGALGRQIEKLLGHTEEQIPTTVPVVVRSTEYQPKSPKTAIAKSFARLFAQQGRYVIVADSLWRAMAASRDFHHRYSQEPDFHEWLRNARPLTRHKPIREILGVDDLLSRPEKPKLSATEETDGRERPTPASRECSTSGVTEERGQGTTQKCAATSGSESDHLLIGYVRSRSREAVSLHPDKLTYHTAFLGSTGSGKTTAALNVIEQLLVQGIPALLVDRKGDLVSYAREEIWTCQADNPEMEERQRRLRQQLEVAVYTPGRPDGRPIALPVAPHRMGEMMSAQRQQVAQQAAHSLGNMLGYKEIGKNAARISVLVKAIELMAELGYENITLQSLIDYIDERDNALISAIGVLSVSLFDPLLEALQTLLINRQSLFGAAGEPLSADDLFGLGLSANPNKTQLSVISTKFLGDTSSIQFWVAQLLLEIDRWMSRNPAKHLRAVVLFDEADLYLPATSKPVTKLPMENLLKRARSAGLGVMLGTQSPGDFDYKARENINTWFIGKIKEKPAIQKMKPMLSELKRDIGAELATQGTGDFYLVRDQQVTSIHSQRSLVKTEQVPEDQILQIARSCVKS